MTIKIEFDVLCEDCGEKLKAHINTYIEKLIVSPCPSCLNDEYRRGFQEGKDLPDEKS